MPHPSAKRRKLNNHSHNHNHRRVEEITFDPEARQEYLTGFHKRKQQRIQNAREAALKREKEERVQERRQIREQRRDDLVRHVEEVNVELRKQNPDLEDGTSHDGSEEGDGERGDLEDSTTGVEQDEEYVDEDKFTTVTVEAMDLGNAPQTEDGDRHSGLTNGTASSFPDKKRNRETDSAAGKARRTKKKKKIKFRYGTKAERQTVRNKLKLKNRAAKARRKDG